jgi:hypothetical protein
MKTQTVRLTEDAQVDAIAETSVHEITLDEQSLDRLFSEIAAAESRQVFFRDGRPPSLKLASNELTVAREALRHRTTRGIQLRYRGLGAEHWDTLTPETSGARLVRLRFVA